MFLSLWTYFKNLYSLWIYWHHRRDVSRINREQERLTVYRLTVYKREANINICLILIYILNGVLIHSSLLLQKVPPHVSTKVSNILTPLSGPRRVPYLELSIIINYPLTLFNVSDTYQDVSVMYPCMICVRPRHYDQTDVSMLLRQKLGWRGRDHPSSWKDPRNGSMSTLLGLGGEYYWSHRVKRWRLKEGRSIQYLWGSRYTMQMWLDASLALYLE